MSETGRDHERRTTTEPTDQHQPRSIRQEQVLRAAANNPDASLQALANELPNTTTTFVETVLDEFGDPAEPTQDTDTPPATPSQHPTNTTTKNTTEQPIETATDSDDTHVTTDDAQSPQQSSDTDDTDATYPDLDELTDKERETLRAIHDQPTATQRTIADTLGVSAATVSARVNNIDGFDWQLRDHFTNTLFTTNPTATTPQTDPDQDPDPHDDQPTDQSATTQATTTTEATATEATATKATETMSESTADATPEETDLETIAARLETIETHLDTTHEEPPDTLTDPELVHKIVHACMHADTITEDEELQIIDALLT